MTEFDDLERSGPESGNDYNFDNWTTIDLDDGEAVVGELEAVIEGVGQYDSTVYLIEGDDGKEMLFGNASIDAGFENSDAEAGDMLGVQNLAGETYENAHGEFDQYEVRFKKAGE